VVKAFGIELAQTICEVEAIPNWTNFKTHLFIHTIIETLEHFIFLINQTSHEETYFSCFYL
jgi:hypothetical protein